MSKYVYEVVDSTGHVEGPLTRATARSYARLWDKDYPDVTPHKVRLCALHPADDIHGRRPDVL